MIVSSSSGGGSGGVSGNSNVEAESRDNMGIIEEEDSLDFSSSVRS